jgi:hypothetical protein
MIELRLAAWILAVASAVGGGCAATLPAHTWTTADEARDLIRARTQSVRLMQAICDLEMIDLAGRRITFDGALAAQRPDDLRLRAWMRRHPAADVVFRGDDVWLWPAQMANGPANPALALGEAPLGDVWWLLTGGFFEGDATWAPQSQPAPMEIFTADRGNDGDRVTCWIDRVTLTPRSYRRESPDHARVYEVHLGQYRVVDGIAWPHRIELVSDAGRIVIDLRTVAFNAPLDAGSFEPLAGAKKLP